MLKVITKLSILFTAIFLMFFSTISMATHIKAGEITASSEPNNPFKYNFTLALYVDSAASPNVLNNVSPAALAFGDGSTQQVNAVPVNLFSQRNIGNSTLKYVFKFSHTYASSGSFTVTFIDFNRNAGILNMNNSVNTSFFLNTSITINPFIGLNNPPIFTIPPIDIANANTIYLHNAGVTDIDGDSLAYKLTVPKMGSDVNTGISVDGYLDPNSPNICSSFSCSNACPVTNFSIDAKTGTITWDYPLFCPNTANLYNIAFVVEEWRNGILLSATVRDMQIRVANFNNKPPKIAPLKPRCAVVGQLLRDTIYASDEDNNRINIFATGGTFEAPNPKSAFNYIPLQLPVAKGFYSWTPECVHVRNQVYTNYYRALDITAAARPLADIKTNTIKVVAPSPRNLKASTLANGVQLKWEPYSCSNGDSILVWRKSNCSPIVIDTCSPKNPFGYTLLASLPITTTSYFDSQAKSGNIYSYRVSAKFSSNLELGVSLSLPSKDTCVIIPLVAPIILNVSVRNTSLTNGSIFLRWKAPTDFDKNIFKPTYGFKVLRKDSVSSSYILINTKNTITDTTYIDSLINTQSQSQTYKVLLTYNNGISGDTSQDASSVFTKATGIGLGIKLEWTSNVPWQYDGFKQYIYREINGNFTLIDSILSNGNSFSTYSDTGKYMNKSLECGKIYRYKIRTQGSYSNPKITRPLLNFSQIASAPAGGLQKPKLTLFNNECPSNEGKNLPNILSWTLNLGKKAICSKALNYQIYFAERKGETLKAIATASDSFYVHNRVDFLPDSSFSVAGCYMVEALGSTTNERFYSDTICTDNCPKYELPNLFTPNQDGINDFMVPLKPLRHTQSAEIDIVNRWGNVVFSQKGSPFIRWDASNVPEGIYYYSLNLKTKRLNPNDESKTIKGWIQILR